jgi:hypothetical protein
MKDVETKGSFYVWFGSLFKRSLPPTRESKNWREKKAEKENTAFPTISWSTIRKVFLRKDLIFSLYF